MIKVIIIIMNQNQDKTFKNFVHHKKCKILLYWLNKEVLGKRLEERIHISTGKKNFIRCMQVYAT